MIENFLKTQITLYKEASKDACGDVTYGTAITTMAKLEFHEATIGGVEGLYPSSTMTAYLTEQCPSNVLIEYSGKKHSSTSVTNYFKFGVYQYTKVELA